MTQSLYPKDLFICDCKHNNGMYCRSTICTRIRDFPFALNADDTEIEKEYLDKILETNVEIYGVHPCGYFSDHQLKNKDPIPQYCYAYDDFTSCFCNNDEDTDDPPKYCKEWICHSYINNAKNNLNIDEDKYSSSNYSSFVYIFVIYFYLLY